MQSIFQQVIQSDPWMLQISQLSLTNPAKKIVMYSWKEIIDSNRICLHLRSKVQCTYSKRVHNIIQTELSNNIGIPIVLEVVKDDDLSKKTPIEYIYTLYIKIVKQLKKRILRDPYIKMMQSFFDIKYDEIDINIL